MAKKSIKDRISLISNNPNVIIRGEKEKEYQKLLNTQSELELINEKFRNIDRYLKNIKYRFPSKDRESITRSFLERRENLRRDLDKRSQDFIWKRDKLEYSDAKPRPFFIGEKYYAELQLNDQIMNIMLRELKPECPELSVGQVTASSFRHYAWAWPDDVTGAGGSGAFWPTNVPVTSEFIAGSTYNGDWAGSTGAYFWSWLNVPGIGIDSEGDAGVFQFTLPAPDCDSVVYWGANGIVRGITENLIDGEWGKIDTDWVVYISSEGGNFPSSLESFSWFDDGLWENSNYPSNKVTYDREDWNLHYFVEAGVQSRIYLGCLVFTQAEDANVWTMPQGYGDYFDFRYGITFFMVPV